MKKTLETVQFETQEEFIRLISKKNSSDIVRFWKPEERLDEDTIFEKYSNVYSVYIVYKYPKQSKRPQIFAYIGKDFTMITNPFFLSYIELDLDVIAELQNWGKKAASILADKLQNIDMLYLREVRFDFLATNKEKTNFVIPNLPLENIKFSSKPRSVNRLPLNEYLEKKAQDIEDFENNPFVIYVREQQKKNGKH